MKLIPLLVSSIFLLAACRSEPQPTYQPPDFDNIAADHSLDAFGGTLEGHDKGEWGGRLAFRNGAGNMDVVFHENVQAILPRGEYVVVFTGLAHMGDNTGAIYLLSPDKARGFRVSGLSVLEGQPQRIAVEAGSDAIRFAVFTGHADARIAQGGWIDLCRRLDSEYRLSTLPDCDAPETEPGVSVE